jgi:hypothetical protein
VAASAQDLLFALAGSLVLVSLASGAVRRAPGLRGAGADFMGAMLLAALALLGAFVAAYSEWSAGAQVLVSATGCGALLGLASASLTTADVRAPSVFGERGLRWTLVTAAVALTSFGWGAVATGGGAAGTGAPGAWVAVTVAAGATAAIGASALAAPKIRASRVVALLLFLGTASLAAGMVILASGAIAVGSAIAMVGGGVVFSATRGPKRTHGTVDANAAEVSTSPALRPRGQDAGVKVRVPKGSGARVTRFRDDGLPPGDNR